MVFFDQEYEPLDQYARLLLYRSGKKLFLDLGDHYGRATFLRDDILPGAGKNP